MGSSHFPLTLASRHFTGLCWDCHRDTPVLGMYRMDHIHIESNKPWGSNLLGSRECFFGVLHFGWVVPPLDIPLKKS